MSGATLTALALAIPLLTALAILAFSRLPNQRDTVSLLGSGALALVCLSLAEQVSQGHPPTLMLPELAPGLGIAFRTDALGALFACVASLLWPLNTLYSIGYMRALRESSQTRYYFCFALALFGAIGIAMAENLFTLFIFYEILTLSTYPLVAHKGDKASRRGGRIYLIALLSTSIGLLLPAIIATSVIAGSTSFTEGGLLNGKASPTQAAFLLPAFLFGIGKAALIPVHFWLPNAMVAPTPVSALLHAVAVVKAGVFTLLKVCLFVFGPELLAQTPSRNFLLMIALGSLLLASLIALMHQNLKARLAWSTIGQLAYVSVGGLLASQTASIAAALQILAHACGKITLFMCAGCIYVATGFTNIQQMRGLGRNMPFLFLAFGLGAASVTGLPPLAGTWPKFLLMQAAWEAGKPLVVAGLILSSLLNLAYLLPIAILGLMPPRSELVRPPEYTLTLSLFLISPPLITAAASLILFFFIGNIADFLLLAQTGIP